MNVLSWIKKFQTPVKKAANFVGYQYVGEPKWTPRRYDALSEEGYCHNVTVYRCVNLISRGLSSIPWLFI
ncbi:MAG TPA: hypothetical protein VI959_02025 [Alphaproteobacteria bacterium]|nr:hypothetical protein [Alphaproteobacteria bacterium]